MPTNDVKQPSLPVQTPDVIDSFRGEFGFLSNFFESSIWIDNERYRSVEHAYQAAKSDDPVVKRIIREAKTPAQAKKLGHANPLIDGWNERRENIMLDLIRKKFENPLLRAMLLATENVELIEGNSWNDTYFGVCRGKGQNVLGKILMQVREECRAQESVNQA
jgi:hypothetical protein